MDSELDDLRGSFSALRGSIKKQLQRGVPNTTVKSGSGAVDSLHLNMDRPTTYSIAATRTAATPLDESDDSAEHFYALRASLLGGSNYSVGQKSARGDVVGNSQPNPGQLPMGRPERSSTANSSRSREQEGATGDGSPASVSEGVQSLVLCEQSTASGRPPSKGIGAVQTQTIGEDGFRRPAAYSGKQEIDAESERGEPDACSTTLHESVLSEDFARLRASIASTIGAPAISQEGTRLASRPASTEQTLSSEDWRAVTLQHGPRAEHRSAEEADTGTIRLSAPKPAGACASLPAAEADVGAARSCCEAGARHSPARLSASTLHDSPNRESAEEVERPIFGHVEMQATLASHRHHYEARRAALRALEEGHEAEAEPARRATASGSAPVLATAQRAARAAASASTHPPATILRDDMHATVAQGGAAAADKGVGLSTMRARPSQQHKARLRSDSGCASAEPGRQMDAPRGRAVQESALEAATGAARQAEVLARMKQRSQVIYNNTVSALL